VTEVSRETVEAARMTRVMSWVAACPNASVTRTVTAAVPAAVGVGVPDSSPVAGSSDSPACRVPVGVDQPNGAVPPVTVSWWL